MSRLYDPGIQPFTVTLDTVTNTSGSYTHTTQNSSITATMKPIQIECSNPDAFGDNITITTSAGEITLTCNEVAGTSDVTVTLMQQVAEAFRPLETTSTEFDILAGRIGTLSSLTTTEQNTIVGSINEINNRLKLFPDPTNILFDKMASGSAWSYTATEDCYAMVYATDSSSVKVKLNDIQIMNTPYTGDVYGGSISLFLKTGDVLSISSGRARGCILGLR